MSAKLEGIKNIVAAIVGEISGGSLPSAVSSSLSSSAALSTSATKGVDLPKKFAPNGAQLKSGAESIIEVSHKGVSGGLALKSNLAGLRGEELSGVKFGGAKLGGTKLGGTKFNGTGARIKRVVLNQAALLPIENLRQSNNQEKDIILEEELDERAELPIVRKKIMVKSRKNFQEKPKSNTKPKEQVSAVPGLKSDAK